MGGGFEFAAASLFFFPFKYFIWSLSKYMLNSFFFFFEEGHVEFLI